MKSIILHDYFKYMEGGGRLCLILAQSIKADLGYGFKIKNHPYFDEYQLSGKEYDLGVFGSIPGLRNILLINAFKRKNSFLNGFDTVIYSGFYSPIAVKNHLEGKNIYYCHTPPRYIYDQYDFYLSRAAFWQRPLIKTLADYHKPLYENALRKMKCILTNSENVKSRIKSYLGFDSIVVYPPCNLHKYSFIGQENFYLSMARLDPLKRVDRIVQAFIDMPDKHLVVISGGVESDRIKRMADGATNIRILGWVSEKELIDLIGHCIATIYIAKDEDFGMSPIESMAAGKPVIGAFEGGLKETILHDETGILLPANPTISDIQGAVRKMTPKRAQNMRVSCHERASFFSNEKFLNKMEKIINN
jgi:glycosyltransferase involved in cell wall biosynthesis